MKTRTTLLALAIVAGLQACAVLPVPVVAPIPPHAIPVGVNDGFHGVLSSDQFAADCPAMIRSPHLSGASLHAFLAAAPCPVLALVEAPDVALVMTFAKENPPAIELGNELELPPFELRPSAYADWIGRAAVALAGVDYRGVIVLGGVYALTDETKVAIRLGLDSCTAAGLVCRVGAHLYDASDADLQWLRDLQWPTWVTETGAHDNCKPAQIQAKAPWLRAQIARLSTVPTIERVFVYQRARGASCSDLDTFGIDGQPAMDLLRK